MGRWQVITNTSKLNKVVKEEKVYTLDNVYIGNYRENVDKPSDRSDIVKYDNAPLEFVYSYKPNNDSEYGIEIDSTTNENVGWVRAKIDDTSNENPDYTVGRKVYLEVFNTNISTEKRHCKIYLKNKNGTYFMPIIVHQDVTLVIQDEPTPEETHGIYKWFKFNGEGKLTYKTVLMFVTDRMIQGMNDTIKSKYFSNEDLYLHAVDGETRWAYILNQDEISINPKYIFVCQSDNEENVVGTAIPGIYIDKIPDIKNVHICLHWDINGKYAPYVYNDPTLAIYLIVSGNLSLVTATSDNVACWPNVINVVNTNNTKEIFSTKDYNYVKGTKLIILLGYFIDVNGEEDINDVKIKFTKAGFIMNEKINNIDSSINFNTDSYQSGHSNYPFILEYNDNILKYYGKDN